MNFNNHVHLISNLRISGTIPLFQDVQRSGFKNTRIHLFFDIREKFCLPLLKRRQNYPIKDVDRPRGFQEGEVPRFQDIPHKKVVRLSAVRTGLFTPQEIFLVPISVRG